MELRKIFSEFDGLLWDEPMNRHTSLRVGGKADLLFVPHTKEQVLEAIALLKDNAINFFVMGNGSNLIVRDQGFSGVIIKISKELGKITVEGNRVRAEAGALMSQLASAAAENSLTGLEFASGIPGSVGGGVCMNAGAYDGEIKDKLISAEVIAEGELRQMSNAQLDFSYRTSRIQREGLVVLSAEFELEPGDRQSIKTKAEDFNRRRREKQPIELPSAGSTFKRPKDNFAGKLIMDCGLSGYSIGGAQVSPKHCGFVVNTGGATAADVLTLMAHIIKIVQEKTGVILEPEVKIL